MSRSTQSDGRALPGRRRGLPRSGGPVLWALLGAALVLVLIGAQALNLLPRWPNPFEEKTRDRSGPAVLKSVRDLSRFEAASGNYQIVVDLERDARFLPDAVRGKRTLFVGTGSVDAYVDFGRLAAGAITVDADRTAATVRLPGAQLEPANLDTRRSYVFAAERGLLDRVGDFFSDRPNDQQQLYILATQKIQAAAAGSGLRERAAQNARTTIEKLLKALGFKTVTVQSDTTR